MLLLTTHVEVSRPVYVFCCLSVAAFPAFTPCPGQIFCLHGGLSPSIETLDHIRALDRVQEVKATLLKPLKVKCAHGAYAGATLLTVVNTWCAMLRTTERASNFRKRSTVCLYRLLN